MKIAEKLKRSKEERIIDALEQISNIHPDLYKKLYDDLLQTDLNDVVKMRKYVRQKVGLPANGRGTKKYWEARGWDAATVYLKVKEHTPVKKVASPFSIEYWLFQINPLSGMYYNYMEADFQRNKIRPIKKEYWIYKGYSLDDAIKKAYDVKTKNNNNGVRNDTEVIKVYNKKCKEYWLSRGYTDSEATDIISKSQVTFSLEICIEKYGIEEGTKRWIKRQQTWHKNFKKSNFSQISQELFWEVSLFIDDLSNVYFAQLGNDKNKDLSGANNEYRLTLDRVLLPDFIDIKQKKIIEYNGSYWHGEVGRGNKTRHLEKLDIYLKNGYKVLEIDEKEYKNNKHEIVMQCVNFLKE